MKLSIEEIYMSIKPRTRRHVVSSIIALPLLGSCTPVGGLVDSQFSEIEALTQGRIGVAAMNLSTNKSLSYRGNERFAMCSTFKWLLAALILEKTDQNLESLSRKIPFTEDDLVTYSPVTKPALAQGGLTVEELCSAAVRTSDNTAANLLINSLGGPSGFTKRVRSFGDQVTRLDRVEPMLNENVPNDPRDTSSPIATQELMRILLFGTILTETSKDKLRGWMIAADTGLDRLRAGIPKDWIAGDKTGTAVRNQSNDVSFAISPQKDNGDQDIVLIVSYINAANPMSPQANAIHAKIAAEVFRALV
jgi:beta-lactamase class A